MQTHDFYTLLGIKPNASAAEIKSAYRRLVKIYHPDMKTGEESADTFKNIQQAYETLSNPDLKHLYDKKRNYTHKTAAPAQRKKRKNYDPSETDLKHRKAFQEEYKNYKAKHKKQQQPAAPPPVSVYNETKYILFSIPLAVALLLAVINLYKPPKKADTNADAAKTSLSGNPIAYIHHTSFSPYTAYFNIPAIDSITNHASLSITNHSGKDAVIVLRLQNSGEVVRNHFIAKDHVLAVKHLKKGDYNIMAYLGDRFSMQLSTKLFQVSGAFSENQSYIDYGKIALSREKETTPFEITSPQKLSAQQIPVSEELYFRANF